MSGKVIWHTMMSLDGFIAGSNDDMQWVFRVDEGDGETADEVVPSIGALPVGRRTQDVEDRLQPGFYGGAYTGPFFVLQHDPPPEPLDSRDIDPRGALAGALPRDVESRRRVGPGEVWRWSRTVATRGNRSQMVRNLMKEGLPVEGNSTRPRETKGGLRRCCTPDWPPDGPERNCATGAAPTQLVAVTEGAIEK